MGSVEVVEVLPFLELLVEEAGVVDDDAVEESVELFGVDAVGSLDLAVEAGRGGLDVDVVDAAVEDVPVEGDWNSAPLSVWIDSTWNGSFWQDVVEELDRGLLVVAFG